MLTLHRPMRSGSVREDPIGPAPWITTTPPGPMTRWAVLHDRRVLGASRFRPYPLVVRRARGTIVEDVDGNRYLDFTAGLTVGPTGHAHHHVISAIERQARRLGDPCGDDLESDPLITLARELSQIAPGHAAKYVLLTNNPAESVEAAIQLACDHTGRNRIIAFAGASHARATQRPCLRTGRGQRREASTASTARLDYLSYGDIPAVQTHLSKAMAAADEVAAILVEPMHAESGYVVPPPAFLPQLRSLCDEHGILLILDETQTGMGRTGKMFACEHQAVVPDILLVACGLAGGMPVCAVVAPESILGSDWAWQGPSFNGNPINCAAALATLELLKKTLIINTARLYPAAMRKLEQIARRHGCIRSPRGLGLMWSVDVVKSRRSTASATQLRDRIVLEAFSRGLLLLGSGKSSIAFTPPLCVNRLQLEVALDVFEEAVATVSD